MEKKRSVRRSDQTHRTRRVNAETNTNSKYTTPLAVAAGALFAFPLVDDLTNMPCLAYIGLAVFAVTISAISVSFSESLRCGR